MQNNFMNLVREIKERQFNFTEILVFLVLILFNSDIYSLLFLYWMENNFILAFSFIEGVFEPRKRKKRKKASLDGWILGIMISGFIWASLIAHLVFSFGILAYGLIQLENKLDIARSLIAIIIASALIFLETYKKFKKEFGREELEEEDKINLREYGKRSVLLHLGIFLIGVPLMIIKRERLGLFMLIGLKLLGNWVLGKKEKAPRV
jgi:magnesium-transporting ATPase (P-type)